MEIIPQPFSDYMSIQKRERCSGQASWQEDGDLFVDGDCYVNALRDGRIPFTFSAVNGGFTCDNLRLRRLEGCPKLVTRWFACNNNWLRSLKGSPQTCVDFLAHDNKLTSLVGAPEQVSGCFDVECNPLTSLQGLPESIGGIITLTDRVDLPLLRLVAHQKVALRGPDISTARRKSEIMNKWGQENGSLRSRIIGCQNELIANGFEGNAKW